MDSIYVLTYEDSEILGNRIFKDFNEALREYLKHCIVETKSILASETDDSSAEDDSCMNCILEIQELNGKEYESVKEYEYEHFQRLLDEKEDPMSYLLELETSLEEDEFPEEILELFSKQ